MRSENFNIMNDFFIMNEKLIKKLRITPKYNALSSPFSIGLGRLYYIL